MARILPCEEGQAALVRSGITNNPGYESLPEGILVKIASASTSEMLNPDASVRLLARQEKEKLLGTSQNSRKREDAIGYDIPVKAEYRLR
jgi:hypothetical protein